MLYNNEEVREFLPHREPFLFVDTVEKLKLADGSLYEKDRTLSANDIKGSTMYGNFFVDEKLDVLRGHFPGNPILPGVVQIEMMAQVSCLTIAPTVRGVKGSRLEVALVSTNDSKFRRPVVPGMNLSIESYCTRVRGPILMFDCKILCENEIVSQTNLMATYNYS